MLTIDQIVDDVCDEIFGTVNFEKSIKDAVRYYIQNEIDIDGYIQDYVRENCTDEIDDSIRTWVESGIENM